MTDEMPRHVKYQLLIELSLILLQLMHKRAIVITGITMTRINMITDQIASAHF